MDTYLLVKFGHLLAVAAAFAASGILHHSLTRVMKAERIPLALDALGTVRALAPRMPAIMLVLFVTGVYLTQNRWTWTQPWIQVGTAGLLSMLAVSLLILKPRFAVIGMRYGQAGDGPVSEELRALIRDPLVSIASHYQAIMAATIIFLMVTKLGMMGSLIAMGVGVALAVGSAVPMMKKGK